MYDKISKTDWEFEGGETNPDLLKLKPTVKRPRSWRYFRLRPGYQPVVEEQEVIVESATDAALRRWREHGKLD